MPALVAKSYEGLTQVCEPYKVNGKDYVKVQLKNGSLKVVRAYSEAEYKKFYPEVKIIQPAKSQKEILGFGEPGYIWLFKGDTYAALDWFRYQPTRYARTWGWYLPSNMEMPQPLPAGITPVKLPWEAVCEADGEHLRPEKELEGIANSYLYDAGTSEWLGDVGDKLKGIPATCTKATEVMGYYGESTIYNFVTDEGDHITWTTSSNQDIEEGEVYSISGTIKKLDTYKNVKKTVLTRCRIVKINS